MQGHRRKPHQVGIDQTHHRAGDDGGIIAPPLIQKSTRIKGAVARGLVNHAQFGDETAKLRAQGIGGSVVFIASKNGLAASPNAAAYCTAKAAEIHLARCLALEGAEGGIRVNVVNPDAVLRGSKIWSGEWLDQRASTYGKDKEGLEEMYRQRSLLKRSVLPEDIAEAAYFFAADLSSKSTGNIMNVDAGNVQAFTR